MKKLFYLKSIIIFVAILIFASCSSIKNKLDESIESNEPKTISGIISRVSLPQHIESGSGIYFKIVGREEIYYSNSTGPNVVYYKITLAQPGDSITIIESGYGSIKSFENHSIK